MDRRQTTADPRIEDFSGKTDTSLVWSSEENCNTQKTIWETKPFGICQMTD